MPLLKISTKFWTSSINSHSLASGIEIAREDEQLIFAKAKRLAIINSWWKLGVGFSLGGVGHNRKANLR